MTSTKKCRKRDSRDRAKAPRQRPSPEQLESLSRHYAAMGVVGIRAAAAGAKQ